MYRFINRRLPRWIVLQIDVFLCVVAVIGAFYLRFNFQIPADIWYEIPYSLVGLIFIKLFFFYIIKPYAGIIRYTSIEDAKKLFKALTLSFFVELVFDLILNSSTQILITPRSVLVIDYVLSLLFLAAFRILAKIAYFEYRNQNVKKTNVIIYGAGEAGMIVKRTLNQYSGGSYHVVAIVDDNLSRKGGIMDGVKIYNTEDFEDLVVDKDVTDVIIAIQKLSPSRKSAFVEKCLALGIQVRSVPPVEKWINGELSLKQIKDVNIEELLGRTPINLDNKAVRRDLEGKIVLVTGAAGSIGSEIARQVLGFSPKLLILLDQNETALYDLELDISELPTKSNFETVIADVRNKDRMRRVFAAFKPEVVFHAAAYKHVPVMEENPSEAVLANIAGTRNVADMSVEFGVKKFVMVSTDKAVNPTSVMGASKRIAEIYAQALNKEMVAKGKPTRFVTTRFGNVLGSNGSVIPRFKKQIAEGGPITITHPEITRYFMTIPEACQLVLEAGSMSIGGEIFLFDMGESVRIVDLAKKMIKLSGLTLGQDIQITFTGLRPGEKLYEELLNNQENTKPTHHSKIMIAQVREYDYKEITKNIDDLICLFETQDNYRIIGQMKMIVPEYVSNNSIYEELDIKVDEALVIPMIKSQA